jgi:hypothetical protein
MQSGSRTSPAFRPSAVAALAFTIAALLMTLAPGAEASPALPTVLTGGADQVGYASATLTGSVNPRGSDASYYFQYGPTKAYGGQTVIADAGAGTSTVNVRIAVAGLQPLTVYHYRLIAVNGAGAATGADRTLLTSKVPLSLAILSAPNPIPYGATATVEGTLSGTGNANSAVALQANPFPYAAGFANVGNPELTLADGSFSFPVLHLTATTQFHVVTATGSVVVSPVVTEMVTPRITTHLARTRRRHVVRIYGTVAPASEGTQVGIMRVLHGRNVLVAGTVLRHDTATSSKFGLVLRVNPGVYRVLVLATGPRVPGYGQPLQIR